VMTTNRMRHNGQPSSEGLSSDGTLSKCL
jgi:hypothetical protein